MAILKKILIPFFINIFNLVVKQRSLLILFLIVNLIFQAEFISFVEDNIVYLCSVYKKNIMRELEIRILGTEILSIKKILNKLKSTLPESYSEPETLSNLTVNQTKVLTYRINGKIWGYEKYLERVLDKINAFGPLSPYEQSLLDNPKKDD
jgi:hypothetical protein